MDRIRPGPVALLGSGERGAVGGRVYRRLLDRLPRPVRVAVLETPAGFEPNSADVAGRWADYLRERTPAGHGDVQVLPARRRGGPDGTDDPVLLPRLAEARMIALGAGSPSYAVRQLGGSLAWRCLVTAHQLGAALLLASAGAIAAGTVALPVYEIFKVGEDLHWKPGLDIFAAFGLRLAVVSHWDNAEGGASLDTRFCYMGAERFQALSKLLPPDVTILGIDEQTALVLDPGVEGAPCQVVGRGGVTVRRGSVEMRFGAGETFAADVLGPFRLPPLEAVTTDDDRQAVRAARAAAGGRPDRATVPGLEVQALLAQREAARAARDWPTSDALRDRLAALGWDVRDTPDGPHLVPRSTAGAVG